jgi:hypothetical protein
VASRSHTRPGEEEDIDVEEELDAIEMQLDRCKVLYEQHFMGIQKMAPEQLHRGIERRMLKLTQARIRNTALRFRFTTLSQKFGSYNTYWRRTMRAIEQGRYVKHIATAARRAARDGKEMPEEMLLNLPKRLRERIMRDRARVADRAEREAARPTIKQQRAAKAKKFRHDVDESALDGDFDFDAMFDAIQTGESPAVAEVTPPPQPKPKPKPAAPSRSAAAPPPRPRPRPAPPVRAGADSSGNALPPGMSETQTRQLFDRYVQAKKLVGEATDKLTYAKLLRTLNSQAPKIMQQHKARSVDFNVVIKDDKVILKAKPKK